MDVADAEDLRGRSRGARELKDQDLQKIFKNLPMMIFTVLICILICKVVRSNSSSVHIDVGDKIIIWKIMVLKIIIRTNLFRRSYM